MKLVQDPFLLRKGAQAFSGQRVLWIREWCSHVTLGLSIVDEDDKFSIVVINALKLACVVDNWSC